jgi:hypothetical protein
LPLDFAAAISGLEAVPPAGAAEADFLGALAAEELAAGAAAELATGAEAAAGAGVVAEAFWLLAFAGCALDVGAGVAADVAGWLASALADFLLLPVVLAGAAVVSAVAGAAAVLAGAVVESAVADFLLRLLFFAVVASDAPVAPVEAEVWSAAAAPEDFFEWLDFDLLELEEVSVLPESALAAVPDFALLLDFLLDDFVSVVAAV